MTEILDSCLPPGWSHAQVKDLQGLDGMLFDGDWILRADLETGTDVRLVQLADIGEGRFLNKSRKFLSINRCNDLGCSILAEGDILISRMAEPIARACILPKLENPAITAVDVAVLRVDSNYFDDRYVCMLLNSQKVRSQAEKLSSGTTRKRISRINLESISIPIAPLREQKRIVSKVEALFSFLDAGVVSLQAIQAQLKRYRQAVLKAAFEGKLTEQWRLMHDSQLSPILDYLSRCTDGPIRRDVPEEVELPEELHKMRLPDKWGRLSVAFLLRKQAIIDLKDGNHGGNHPKSEEFSLEGIPFITASQVGDFEIDYENAPKLDGEPLKRLRVGFSYPNDVILSHKGTVGRVSINTKDCILSPQTTYYRVSPNVINAKFLAYYFSSPIFQNQLSAVKSQTTRDFVSISKQYHLFIILCPLNEQQEIVTQIDHVLTIIRKTEYEINRNIRLSENQRQSILKRAFEGTLVSQDPSDESAKKLLERIKTEKITNKKQSCGVVLYVK